jgi:hypothetical protein
LFPAVSTSLLLCLLTLAGCGPAPEPAAKSAAPEKAALTPGQEFGAAIQQAHGAAAWHAHRALQTGIVVQFGSATAVDGTMLIETSGARSRFELKDGTILVFDGEHAWVSPAASSFARARFHTRTWPYFLAAPMKLMDPGAKLEATGPRGLFGKTCNTAKLSFEPGVGDTPDDWYVVYQDPETKRLAGLAYVVTYGKPLAEAEKEPHAVQYANFVEIDGVTIPTEWSFGLWSEAEGFYGDPIGKVTLTNPQFVEPPDGAFVKPEDAKEDAMPQ